MGLLRPAIIAALGGVALALLGLLLLALTEPPAPPPFWR